MNLVRLTPNQVQTKTEPDSPKANQIREFLDAEGRYVLGFWCVPCNTHWTSALPNYQPNPFGIPRIQR
jgi:hypothetical protein